MSAQVPAFADEAAPAERRKSERRRRELEWCARYFSALRRSQEPTPAERFSADAATWAAWVQGAELTPREAMRLPRLVPQPKAWVRELCDEVRNGEG